MAGHLSSLIAVFIGMWVAFKFMDSQEELPTIQKNLNKSYDYIVVGAGSAGATIASRLSENPDTTVLLLEAGGLVEDNPNIDAPSGTLSLLGSDQDWNYFTVPQKSACQSLDKHRSFWPRGRVLGGSSSINGMVYIRGSRYDFDLWEKDGCKGWSYKDVLPYFLKSEDIRSDRLKNSPYHRRGGLLTVSEMNTAPLQDKIIKAGTEMGYNNTDVNGRSQIGFYRTQATAKDGVRWSTYRAFVKPAMKRQNLHVSINSFVTKIEIKNKQARGVTVVIDGRKKTITARKEVIVSGGSVNSPQLLLLSGIGPKAHLDELGIKQVMDLPVGENLQDHLATFVEYSINTTDSITDEKWNSYWTLLKYNLLGTGYKSFLGLEGVSFGYNDGTTHDKGAAPDFEVQFYLGEFFSKRYRDNFMYNIAEKEKDKLFNHVVGKETFIMIPTLLHPKSRGTIRLRSRDPFDHPIIEPHYFEDPSDLKTLVEAAKFGEKLSTMPTLKQVGASLLPKYVCTEYKINSDEYWECYIRHVTLTLYHPTTTCRMGPAGDPTAVVDEQLRVHGIKRLRVADASVMRNVPSGNTNAPSIMIGEKAADMIRGINSVKDIQDNLPENV